MWKSRKAKKHSISAHIHHVLSVKEARKLKNVRKLAQLRFAKINNSGLINKYELAFTKSLVAVHNLGSVIIVMTKEADNK